MWTFVFNVAVNITVALKQEIFTLHWILEKTSSTCLT